jgi:uncharacterized protein YdhG (YjbR/CyaY superfamily)
MPVEQKFRDVDHYISTFDETQQQALRCVRETIRQAAPEASETITYHMPTYVLDGRYLVYFAAYKKHLSVFGLSGSALSRHAEAAKPYVTAKGALRIPFSRLLPLDLVADLVRASAEDIESHRRQAS